MVVAFASSLVEVDDATPAIVDSLFVVALVVVVTGSLATAQVVVTPNAPATMGATMRTGNHRNFFWLVIIAILILVVFFAVVLIVIVIYLVMARLRGCRRGRSW